MSSCVIVHSLAETTRGSVQPGVHLIAYDFDTNPRTLQDSIQATTSRSSVRNCGLNIQCADGRLALTNDPNTVVDTKGVLRRGSPSRRFFAWLIGERLADGSFLDFFLIKPIENCAQLGVILQTLTGKKVSVRFIPRFTATDLQPHNRRIVAVYFKLTSSSSSLREGGGGRSGVEAELSRVPSAIANYERIRVVGKGAFGAAVLYRRREDESLVIIKEISMHQLAATERQLAKNEVDVLARLEHPHIVSYFDSFEEDGLLLIEMEYADGGTLAQFLSACTDFVGEDTVTALFEQIFSAVAYLHENKVLHRDLKTANIFLTQDGDVKIGDFGISKLMGAETLSKGATTLVGTPHYLSPEMCEGKPYNEKSDMWALGCIMYESMCLQKAFDADSLPALVNKICKSQFEPVRGPYSNGLKLLVRDLLSLETTTRPAATAALQRLARGRVAAPFRPKLRGGPARSTLYRMDISTMALEAVDSLPTKTQIRQVSLSSNHFIAVCSSGEVFTWGENGQGQLGLGDTSRFSKYRNSPGRVESLREMRIQCAAAGMGFSFFCADRGTLWACGDGGMCQSGEGSKLVSPCLIDALFSSNVLEVACGDEHVVVLCEGGGIWAWGRSQPFTIKPQQIEIPNNVSVVAIRCGPDASALITVDGTLIAWGVNKHNKLNLAKRQGFFAREPKNAYEFIEKPTLVKGFPARVVDVTIGRHHTGVILETGTVHMFGRNSWGELGLGGLGPQPQPCAHFPVKGLLQKTCLHIVCGEGFSLASTAEQELFFWGSKGVRIEEVEQNKNEKWGEKRNGVSVHHLVPNPSLVLRLDSSPSSGISIGISGLVADGRTAMLLIDTVAIRDPPPTANNRTPTVSQSAQLATRAKFSSDSDPTAVATWLRREMDEATFIAHRRNSSAGDLPKPEKKAFSAKEKPRRSGSLQRQQHGHTVVGVEKKLPAVDAPPRYEELAPRSQKITKSTTCSIL